MYYNEEQMEEVLASITNGQRAQALEQMERYNIDFKELYLVTQDGYEIAVLADMKGL